MVLFDRNFNSILRRDHQKISFDRRANECRRKEPILGYVPKKRRKKEFLLKGLN